MDGHQVISRNASETLIAHYAKQIALRTAIIAPSNNGSEVRVRQLSSAPPLEGRLYARYTRDIRRFMVWGL